ncbi:MAG: 2-phosphosulfolactate phosphatase [Bryobacterales bacterium]|jgi:2-phosphosulfolactate phosphatase|nr:2-phosphosulfolactate phosphatase [Bryobacterales bacterium]
MTKTVTIDYLPESALRYQAGYAAVAIDVIRATTTAVTAVATSRRCFPVPDLESAHRMASVLGCALLAGEKDGEIPEGFDIDNSPAEMVACNHTSDPVVLLSSSGTRLICNGSQCDALYVACLRNYSATVRRLVDSSCERIAVLGAGSRDEFREEDQMACAWITEQLLDEGYEPATTSTRNLVRRWSGAKPTDFLHSRSVSFLRRTNKLHDLDFVLEHIDDLDTAYVLSCGEIVRASKAPFLAPAESDAGLEVAV